MNFTLRKLFRYFLLGLMVIQGFTTWMTGNEVYGAQTNEASTLTPTVHIPYVNGEIRNSQTAVFWLGQINKEDNYADVRIAYNDAELYAWVAIFDKDMWYNQKSDFSQLDQWDAVSIYLSPDPSTVDVPFQPIRLISQVNHWQDDQKYQQAWVKDGEQWQEKDLFFTTKSSWRGSSPNDNSSAERGWTTKFRIPFTSLGLTAPPSSGSRWRLAVVVHDRDDAAGTTISEQSWPPALNREDPQTWGTLSYGPAPAYVPPAAINPAPHMIRQGLDGAVVPDAEVGGNTTCGNGLDFWSDWGDTNYAGGKYINIQNQTDVADWPCYAKYYVTFPLDSLPPGKAVISATLMLHQFGNSGQGWDPGPFSSNIHIYTVLQPWEESSLTWNNAPPAHENVSNAWVDPLESQPPWPGIARTWDLSQAVAEMYANGGPLRLALYSADSAYHSGKYFISSDAEDWNAQGRPTLLVTLGSLTEPASPSPLPDDDAQSKLYLPALTR